MNTREMAIDVIMAVKGDGDIGFDKSPITALREAGLDVDIWDDLCEEGLFSYKQLFFFNLSPEYQSSLVHNINTKEAV